MPMRATAAARFSSRAVGNSSAAAAGRGSSATRTPAPTPQHAERCADVMYGPGGVAGRRASEEGSTGKEASSHPPGAEGACGQAASWDAARATGVTLGFAGSTLRRERGTTTPSESERTGGRRSPWEELSEELRRRGGAGLAELSEEELSRRGAGFERGILFRTRSQSGQRRHGTRMAHGRGVEACVCAFSRGELGVAIGRCSKCCVLRARALGNTWRACILNEDVNA